MTFKRKFWGVATAIAVAISSTLLPTMPAAASSVSVNYGATTNTFTTPSSGMTALAINSLQRSFQNPLGGMYEVTTPNTGSTTLTVQAFFNGAMDTRFNSTGTSTFTAQYTSNTRSKLFFSTYANGTKWAVLENPWSSSGYNYLHLGTVAAGYQSTVTLPTTTSNNTTCTSKITAVNSGATNLLSDMALAPDTGAASPILSLSCGVYLNTATNYVNWLFTYSGGTVLGTPATYADFSNGPVGPMSFLNSSTKKYIINYGVSANPSATAGQPILTYLSAMTDTNPTGSPTTGDSYTLNDLVVTRVAANGSVTHQAAAWTGQSAGGRTGMVVVVPRNNGTVYALLNASDGTNFVAKILTFGTSGAASAQTNVTGSSFVTGFSRVALMEAQGTTLKFASIDLGGYNPSYFDQVDASTGVATRVASFVLSGGSTFESFLWQMTNTSTGADFYSRVNSTSVLRLRTSTVPTSPSTPVTPTVVIGNTYVRLSWPAVTDGGSPVTAYTVEYSTNGTVWTTWSSSISTLGTTITGLTNGTQYVFRVSATNAIGTSTFSPSTTSAIPLPVPEPPDNFVVTGYGNNTVRLNWTAPAAGGSSITDYRIEYGNVNTGVWAVLNDAVSILTTNTQAYSIGFTYSFRVSAINSFGAGPPSTVSPEILMANMPSGITVAPSVSSVSPGNLTVSWVAPSNGGSPLTGVEVQTSTDGVTFPDSFTSSNLSGTLNITGLTPGSTYYTRVRARNFFGYSTTWSPVSIAAIVATASVPGLVTNLAATPGTSAGTADLSWTAAPDNGSPITDYTIQYSSDGGVTWTTWSHAPFTTTSATVTGLTAGTNYIFKVSAVNSVGSSSATSPTAPVAAAQPAPSQSPNLSAPEPVKLPTNIQVPSKVDAAAGKVTFGGENLEAVKTVLMNNIEAPILDRTAQNLTVSIPKEILGWVDVEFITGTGKSKFMSLIYVENLTANRLAKLRLGYETNASLKLRSTKRFNSLSVKFKDAKTATCIGHYSKSISRKQAITRAKHACGLVLGSTRKATVRIALSKEQLHAHVLVLFDY